MNPAPLSQLLAALARAVGNEQRQAAVGSGLLSVQFAILGYLRDANRYSNTQSALTEYLGLTKGTVSQSLKVLEERAWIARQTDEGDRRIVRLALSAAGRRQLELATDDAWRQACASLDDAERLAAGIALTRLLSAWQRARNGRTFGVCHSCQHFRPGHEAHQCGLTGETLSDDDSRHICREHTLSEAAPSFPQKQNGI